MLPFPFLIIEDIQFPLISACIGKRKVFLIADAVICILYDLVQYPSGILNEKIEKLLIPHSNIEKVDAFLAPYREKRNVRNRKMIENINSLVSSFGMALSFDNDVLPLSTTSVTERHLLFALAKKITGKYTEPEQVVAFMKDVMGITVSGKNEENILNGKNTPDFYEYDILGVLKGNLVEKIYVDADAELPKIEEYIDMVRRNGGISAYAYLGDVGNSVTGDKKTQKFEDDYIEQLFDVIENYGFDAVTFMPTRNTEAQLDRVMELCKERGLFQISGEDINSPRQKFVCPAYENPKFAHLVEAAHTLIKYENLADTDLAAARKLIGK